VAFKTSVRVMLAPDLAPGWRRLVYLAPKHPTAWVFDSGF